MQKAERIAPVDDERLRIGTLVKLAIVEARELQDHPAIDEIVTKYTLQIMRPTD